MIVIDDIPNTNKYNSYWRSVLSKRLNTNSGILIIKSKLYMAEEELKRPEDIWPELIRTYDEYVNLIGEECDELATSAINRGWRSTRVEEGKRLRDKITELKSKL